MAIKIGDKVRFLSETGGGIVSSFVNKDVVNVRDEDGFDIPMHIKECVVIDTNEYNIKIEQKKEIKKDAPEVEKPVVENRPVQESREGDYASLWS